MFTKYYNLKWGISEKSDGSMRLGDKDIDENIENREKFFRSKNIDPKQVVSARLCHGNKMCAVDNRNAGKIIRNIDGLVTNEKNLFLSITVADCLPVFIYDPLKKVIGLVHSGWRGTEKNIVKQAINKMTAEYGVKPENIEIYIGPHIKDCHFEVSNDIVDRFKPHAEAIIKRGEKTYINLAKIVSTQLEDENVKSNNIETSKTCTYCDNNYFSYRRDKPETVEAMVVYLGITNP